jgi:enoyl-CoA hydratase
MSNALRVDSFDDRVLITFTRPEIRNPLSVVVVEELIEVLENLARQDEVRRVDLTGSGNVFASGADLREIALLDASKAREFAERGQRLMNLIESLPQETRALINGACYGGALDLALACDRRIASSNATFCHPGVRLGIITGWGGTQRLPRLIGSANASEMFFIAAPFSSTQAFKMGLIDHIDDSHFARLTQS